jgi:hypothetical protein
MSDPLLSLDLEEEVMSSMQAQVDQPPAARAQPRSRLVALSADRWRVVAADGHVHGLVERVQTPAGDRFRALRFHAPSRAFRAIGEFWRMSEASDTLRLSR